MEWGASELRKKRVSMAGARSPLGVRSGVAHQEDCTQLERRLTGLYSRDPAWQDRKHVQAVGAAVGDGHEAVAWQWW